MRTRISSLWYISEKTPRHENPARAVAGLQSGVRAGGQSGVRAGGQSGVRAGGHSDNDSTDSADISAG